MFYCLSGGGVNLWQGDLLIITIVHQFPICRPLLCRRDLSTRYAIAFSSIFEGGSQKRASEMDTCPFRAIGQGSIAAFNRGRRNQTQIDKIIAVTEIKAPSKKALSL